MSGPTTGSITADAAIALLAAAALAIQEAQADAEFMQEQHAEARDDLRSSLRNAAQAGAAAREQALADAEARFNNLITAAKRLGLGDAAKFTRPVRPAATDIAALNQYLASLQALADALEKAVLTEAARHKEDLAELAPEIQLPAQLAKPTAAPVQKLLARIAHLGALPEDIATLAREIENTPPGERAELLATELRRRIQQHAEETQQAELERAKALIIEHTLKDLGYQVEDVAATLFVSGGIVHFRKRDWGDYMVRMRIDAAASTANFNVIRAVKAGENERSVLDHIAEDRWCAEFPALLQALGARGVHIDVTRRLEAGELPVQLVDRDKLPQFANEEERSATAKPIARTLK